MGEPGSLKFIVKEGLSHDPFYESLSQKSLFNSPIIMVTLLKSPSLPGEGDSGEEAKKEDY
jgi:hypothetical protein